MTLTKICTICKIEKSLIEFHNSSKSKDGKRCDCKECRKSYGCKYWKNNKDIITVKRNSGYYNIDEERANERWKEYYKNNKKRIKNRVKKWTEYNKKHIKEKKKEYYENNKEKINNQNKEYRKQNRDQLAKKQKEYYQIEENRIRASKVRKEYYENNKEILLKKQYEYKKNKLKTDVQFKLTEVLRSRLHSALKGNFKNGSAVNDLGCTIEELKIYLESKFEEGMDWDNWSIDGWHIDHIIPLSSFDLTDREQFLKACNYTNLQPLWAKDNLQKGDKLIY